MDETPLNADELAAAYLKSRDVPCPSCAYNRRGGVSATCPECGHVLAILHEDGGWKQAFSSLAQRYLLLLTLVCAFVTIMWGISTLMWVRYVVYTVAIPNLYIHLIRASLSIIAYLIILIWSARLWRRIRKGSSASPKQAARPMLAYLAVVIVLSLSNYVMNFI
jgi:hypothetical protein